MTDVEVPSAGTAPAVEFRVMQMRSLPDWPQPAPKLGGGVVIAPGGGPPAPPEPPPPPPVVSRPPPVPDEVSSPPQPARANTPASTRTAKIERPPLFIIPPLNTMIPQYDRS